MTHSRGRGPKIASQAGTSFLYVSESLENGFWTIATLEPGFTGLCHGTDRTIFVTSGAAHVQQQGGHDYTSPVRPLSHFGRIEDFYISMCVWSCAENDVLVPSCFALYNGISLKLHKIWSVEERFYSFCRA